MNTSFFSTVFKNVFGESITPTASQYVPITASDGTPAGISSMVNLASVLGVINKGAISTTLSDCYSNAQSGKVSSYYYGTNVSDAPDAANGGCVINLKHSSYLYGVQLANSNNKLYMRGIQAGVFSAWAEVASNIPSFYKSYGNIIAFADGLSNIGENTGALGQVIASGKIDDTVYPTSYGTVIKFKGYYPVLMCIDSGGNYLYIKVGTNDWKRIDTTAV